MSDLLGNEADDRNDAPSLRTDPIAIVGIGCRFPAGADSPERFWQLLTDEVDAISPVPRDRWSVRTFVDPDPTSPGRMYAAYGAFLSEIDRFDPAFFGLSPR
jgi:acyl transferase domain-containing protein